MSKKELHEKEAREAAAKKAAEEWKAKQEADKALLERRKAATAAGALPLTCVCPAPVCERRAWACAV
jgi:hypothetical protein